MRRINIIIVLIIMLIVITPNILKASEKKYNYNDSVKIANNYMYNLIKDNSYNRYLITNTNNRYYKESDDDFSNGGLLSYKEFLITVNNNNPSTSYLYSGDDYWTYTKSNGDNNFVVSRTINYTKNKNKDKTNVKVTQYIKDDISVSGSGTIQDPWQFVPKYNIELDRTGGSGGPDRVSVFYLNHLPDISTPTKVGYSFDGYYTELNGKGKRYYQSDGKSDIPWDEKSDSILYAKWKPNKVNIKFHAGGATSITSKTGSNYWKIGSNGNITHSSDNKTFNESFWSKEYNSKIDLPNYNNSEYINITKLGYTGVPGKQWCTGPNGEGVCYDQNIEYDITTFCSNITTSDCNIQLYMNWKPNKINIKFHAGGATNITSKTGSNYWKIDSNGNITHSSDNKTFNESFWSREYNSKIDLPDYNNSGYINITKLGYKGVPGKQWCTKPNGEGVCYDQTVNYDITKFCSNITISDCTIQLYMNWKPNKVNIKFYVGADTNITSPTGSNYWKIGSDGYIYNSKDNKTFSKDFWSKSYSSNFDLPDYNNPGYIDIRLPNYGAVSGEEWCPKPNGEGTCYDQSTNYNIKDFCSNIEQSDCDITLYMNWQENKITYTYLANNYKCSNGSKVTDEYVFEYTGQCEVIDDGNDNWRLRFLTSGDFSCKKEFFVDMFLVGGGAQGGGYGGMVNELGNYKIYPNNTYKIIVGNSDEDTSIKSIESDKVILLAANGNKNNILEEGVCEFNENLENGKCKYSSENNYKDNGYKGIYATKGGSKYLGAGRSGTDKQKCEWDWYASTYCCCRQVCQGDQTPGAKNTGSGGARGTHYCSSTKGGSGIVIFRNAKPDIIVNGKVIGTYTGKFKVYESNSNWYVKFTTSGILSLNSSKQVDMFLVGGGAEYGGYGGYSSTKKNISLNANKDYYIEIGQSDQDTNFKDNNGTIIYSAARGTKTAGSNANGVCEFNEVNSDGTCKSKITNNFNGLYAAKGDSKLAGAGSKGTDTQRCEWDWGTSAYCCCRQVCDGNQVPAEKNSGSGGGGITHYCPGTKGGSGVIIIRNTR